jgi:hypothetical protein
LRSEPVVMLEIARDVVVAFVVVEFWMETFWKVEEAKARRPFENVRMLVVALFGNR